MLAHNIIFLLYKLQTTKVKKTAKVIAVVWSQTKSKKTCFACRKCTDSVMNLWLQRSCGTIHNNCSIVDFYISSKIIYNNFKIIPNLNTSKILLYLYLKLVIFRIGLNVSCFDELTKNVTKWCYVDIY